MTNLTLFICLHFRAVEQLSKSQDGVCKDTHGETERRKGKEKSEKVSEKKKKHH